MSVSETCDADVQYYFPALSYSQEVAASSAAQTHSHFSIRLNCNLKNGLSGRARKSPSLTFHFVKKACGVLTAHILWVVQKSDTKTRIHMTATESLLLMSSVRASGT